MRGVAGAGGRAADRSADARRRGGSAVLARGGGADWRARRDAPPERTIRPASYAQSWPFRGRYLITMDTQDSSPQPASDVNGAHSSSAIGPDPAHVVAAAQAAGESSPSAGAL